MNKIIKILIYTVGTIVIFGGFVSTAFAVSPLTAIFNPEPLFKSSNFVPGDKAEAEITISNNTKNTQTAYIEAVNVSNNDNLASQMKLEIFEGATEIYNDNFGVFLNAGPVLLSSIGASGSKTFNLKITFIENTGNDYQNKTLGFDVCVGFSGGNQHCTNDIAISDEEGNTGSTGGSGGGGGSSSGSHRLVIFNENASNIVANGFIPESGMATITWQTNIPATSQVVYGLASGAPYTLDTNILPGLGYPLYNSEDFTKIINHSMLLTGLTPGETYVFRVVSRASPATVSFEHQFTVPIPGASNIIITNSLGAATNQGEVLGANDTDSNEKDGMAKIFGVNNLATVVASGWGDLLSKCSLFGLIILLIGYLIWRLFFKGKYKFHSFFGMYSLLAIVIALIFKQFCPIPIFILGMLVALLSFLYNLYSK